jgi:hypothetical protein
MNPNELKEQLSQIVEGRLTLSVMIWGPPGIGKSSIVHQVAIENKMDFIDLRLSQLSPTDLRGLPVPKGNAMGWLPPDFLPQKGKGILFLDEINLAPPAIQGIAQQLVLDRRVGNYKLPDDWHIWAAGNRKEDRASVFEMPAPLANRFIHFDVASDFGSFRKWAVANEIDEKIISFLAFRPALLHQQTNGSHAWPSSRTWAMADKLLKASLPIASAVGEGPAGEYLAYTNVYKKLPDLDVILSGKGKGINYPKEASVRFAATIGLGLRAQKHDQLLNAFRWLMQKGGAEWVQLFLCNAVDQAEARGHLGMIATAIRQEPRMRKFLSEYRQLDQAA